MSKKGGQTSQYHFLLGNLQTLALING